MRLKTILSLLLSAAGALFFTNEARADFGTPETVSATLPGDAFKVYIQPLPSGQPVAMWWQYDKPTNWESWPQRIGVILFSSRESGSWSTPEVVVDRVLPFSTGLVAQPVYPKMVVANDGSITIVYVQTHCVTSNGSHAPWTGCGLYTDVSSVTRSAAGIWGPPQVISGVNNQTGIQSEPQIGIADDGTITAAWVDESNLPNGPIQVATRSSGGTWSGPQSAVASINYNSDNFGWDLNVAPDGGVAIGYIISEGGAYTVHVISHTGGSVSFSSPQIVSPVDSTYTQTLLPEVGIASGGKIVAMWRQYSAATDSWYLRTSTRLAGSSSWLTAQTVVPDPVDDRYKFELEMTDNGIAVGLWLLANDRQLEAGTEASSSSVFGNVTSLTPGVGSNFINYLTLSAGPGGTAAASWTLFIGSSLLNAPKVVQASILSDGGSGWDAARTISPSGRGVSSATVGPDGNVSVIYGTTLTYDAGALFSKGLEAVSTAFSGNSTPTPTPTPTPMAPGSLSVNGKTFKQKNGTVTLSFKCAGAAGSNCKGSAQFFTQKTTGKGPKQKVTKVNYGTCKIAQVLVPAKASCSMKLSSAAKSALKISSKLKGSLTINSDGVSNQSTSQITVNR